jgi:hypothetical protein
MLVRGNDDASLRDRGKPFFSPDGRFRAAPFFGMKEFYTTANAVNIFSDVYKDVYKQRIDLYDGQSDKRLRELDGGKAPAMGVVPATGFSFDGKLIAMTGFEQKDRSILIYDTGTGRKVISFKINDDELTGQ